MTHTNCKFRHLVNSISCTRNRCILQREISEWTGNSSASIKIWNRSRIKTEDCRNKSASNTVRLLYIYRRSNRLSFSIIGSEFNDVRENVDCDRTCVYDIGNCCRNAFQKLGIHSVNKLLGKNQVWWIKPSKNIRSKKAMRADSWIFEN